MLDYLRDPLWQFIGAALAALALLAMFLIYMLQRTNKGVMYEVLSRTSLLTVREELEGKLQVLYEGEPANSLTLIVLKVWNSGNQPILSTDFERPLSFCTGDAAFLLTAAVIQVEPLELAVDFSVCEGRLTVTPGLLNPGDSMTFKLLVRNVGKSLHPDARIAGVKTVQQADKKKSIINARFIMGVVIFYSGLMYPVVIDFIENNQKSSWMPQSSFDFYFTLMLMVIGFLLLIDINFSQVRRYLERFYR
jgi:hypothetical protein